MNPLFALGVIGALIAVLAGFSSTASAAPAPAAPAPAPAPEPKRRFPKRRSTPIPKPQPKPEPKEEKKTEPKPEPRPKPEPKEKRHPWTRRVPQPEPKPEPKPEPQPEPQPEPEPVHTRAARTLARILSLLARGEKLTVLQMREGADAAEQVSPPAPDTARLLRRMAAAIEEIQSASFIPADMEPALAAINDPDADHEKLLAAGRLARGHGFIRVAELLEAKGLPHPELSFVLGIVARVNEGKALSEEVRLAAVHARLLDRPDTARLLDERADVLEALEKAAEKPAPAPAELPPLPDYPLTKQGDEGQWVKKAQDLLIALGYRIGTPTEKWPLGKPDQDFGEKLKAAVKKFQQEHLRRDGAPLTDDGKIGKETWWALENPRRKGAPGSPAVAGGALPSLTDPLSVGQEPWQRFCAALRTGQVSEITVGGLLGAYRLSPALLQAAGLMSGARREGKRWAGSFRAPLTMEKFLTSPEVQDRCFAICMHKLGAAVRQELSGYLGSVQEEQPMSLSGLLAVVKQAGADGAVQWCLSAKDKEDHPNTTLAFKAANGLF